VTAASTDGLTSTTSASYTVIVLTKAPPPHGVTRSAFGYTFTLGVPGCAPPSGKLGTHVEHTGKGKRFRIVGYRYEIDGRRGLSVAGLAAGSHELTAVVLLRPRRHKRGHKPKTRSLRLVTPFLVC
jgi:hypothetical protein